MRIALLLKLSIGFLLMLAISTFFLLHGNNGNSPLASIDLRLPSTYSNGCHLKSQASNPLPCRFGNSNASSRIYLFGDSHAAQWIPALMRAGSIGHFQGRFLTKSSCPFVYLDLDKNCNEWQLAAIQQIIKEKPDLLILASLTNEPYIQNYDQNQYSNLWIRGLKSIIEMIPSETKLMLINDSPYLTNDPIPCLKDSEAKQCKFKSTTSATTIRLEKFSKLNNIFFQDLTVNICQEDICLTGDKKINYFRDSNHLSYIFSEKKATILAKSLNQLLGD